jgi:Zn-dependent peptidase ImmA (M78 family)/DNA-binding XRE family transcriptional regulator
MVANFNPEQLTLLRERVGITKEELAFQCGVSRRTVTSWENGEVTAPAVDVLARVFDVDQQFFSRSSPQALDPSRVSFRALSSLGARKTKRVLAAARLSLQFNSWLDEHFSTPAADLPSIDDLVAPQDSNDVSPAEVARLLRAAWGLGDRPLRNITTLLERHGIRIMSVPAEDRDVDAFSFWTNGRPFVFLSTEKSAERLRFDLAHETGHLVLHKGLCTARERRYELEANHFASAFLMPSDGLVAQVATSPGRLRMQDVLVMKKSWRVSAAAMVRRLFDLQLIGEWHYRTWMIDLSSQGYRRSEPDGLQREQSLLISTVLVETRKSGMTLEDIADDCGVPKDTIEQALLGLALVPLGGPRRRPPDEFVGVDALTAE